MTQLLAQLQRLYFLPDQAPPPGLLPAETPLDLVSSSGHARTLVIAVTRTTDWPHVAALYQALQEDLELPAPALTVTGSQGFQLWFSLAEAVPLDQAEAFLKALRQRYLSELGDNRCRLYPGPDGRQVDRVPAFQATTGLWSAYIDPTMGSMFAEDGGLPMAPNPHGQADILADLNCTKPDEFQQALARLGATSGTTAPSLQIVPPVPMGKLSVGSNAFADPRDFLLAVMNDSGAPAELRVEAAKALLPYFAEARHS